MSKSCNASHPKRGRESLNGTVAWADASGAFAGSALGGLGMAAEQLSEFPKTGSEKAGAGAVAATANNRGAAVWGWG